MYAYRLFVQRRRRTVTRLAVLLALGIGGTMAALPKTDAFGGVSPLVIDVLLLTGEPMSAAHFGAFHWAPQG